MSGKRYLRSQAQRRWLEHLAQAPVRELPTNAPLSALVRRGFATRLDNVNGNGLTEFTITQSGRVELAGLRG